jgi:ribosome maturation factor RimP
MDVSGQIAELAGPAAQSAGMIVDGVDVAMAGSRTRVLVTVDLPDDAIGAADLDTVAEASRAIGAALDEAGVPKGAYVLEVSTPGTDRILTERRHFLRARTRMVELDLTDGTQTTGRLSDLVEDTLVLDTDGVVARIALADVTRGRVQVEFKKTK